jgi:HAD superfamily hydrolase (TIGR01509 family)
MNWSAVIFDMDGLMIDSEPIALEAWRALAAEYDREVPAELYQQVIGETPMYGVQHLRSELDLPLEADELLEEYWSRRTELMCDKVQPSEGLVELLELLRARGAAIAVASNSPCDYILAVLKSLGLETYFKCVLSSEDVDRGKPAPDVYRSALECLGIGAENVLVLEDSPAGIEAAKAAGLTCYAVPNEDLAGADFSAADRVFDSLNDVVATLNES